MSAWALIRSRLLWSSSFNVGGEAGLHGCGSGCEVGEVFVQAEERVEVEGCGGVLGRGLLGWLPRFGHVGLGPP